MIWFFDLTIWILLSRVDDEASITANPINSLVCSEAGNTTVFSLMLTSQPTSSVTIGVRSSDTTEGRLGNVSTIMFTSSVWFVAQTVTVTGANDDTVDGSVAFSVVVDAALSDDTNYYGLNSQDVNVTNKDGMVFRSHDL